MKVLSNTVDKDGNVAQKPLVKVSGIVAISITFLFVTGCFNSNNYGNNTPSSSTKLATQLADSEPGKLDDPAALKSDLNRLFGNPDDEPVNIEDGETLADIFKKTGS